jgi:hypothetical protein
MTWPDRGLVGLGWGVEYWDHDPSRYEGWQELRDRGKALHRKWSRLGLALRLSDDLLTDVVVAASGVEHSIAKLHAARSQAQAYADEHVGPAAAGGPLRSLQHPSVIDAWFEFANVVSWVRILDERLDRRFMTKNQRRQGLLPAIRPTRLRKRVNTLVDALRHGQVGETRNLANYVLHAALLRNPYSGGRVDEAGQLRLPIPDRTMRRIDHRDLFTWQQDRDGFDFADHLWEEVETFIDDLLDAFERAIPRRLRRAVN